MTKKKVTNWLKHIVIWMRDAPDPIYGLLTIVAAVLFYSHKPEYKDYLSFYLQFVGMLATLKVLFNLQKEFNEPIWSYLKNWLISFPKWKLEPIIGHGNYKTLPATICGRAVNGWTDHKNGLLEERLDKISHNIEILLKQDTFFARELDALVNDHESAKINANKALKESTKKIEEKMKYTFINDIPLSLTGITLVAAGLFLDMVV